MKIIRLRKISKVKAIKKKVLDVMKDSGLMVMVSLSNEERMIYQNGRFFSRDKPLGVMFEDIWKIVAENDRSHMYVFKNGRVALDINQMRMLVIE